MREGEILDVINEVLFGEPTQYPIEDFRVRSIRHLGYLRLYKESKYLDLTMEGKTVVMRWKKILSTRAINMARQYGGDISILSYSGVFGLE